MYTFEGNGCLGLELGPITPTYSPVLLFPRLQPHLEQVFIVAVGPGTKRYGAWSAKLSCIGVDVDGYKPVLLAEFVYVVCHSIDRFLFYKITISMIMSSCCQRQMFYIFIYLFITEKKKTFLWCLTTKQKFLPEADVLLFISWYSIVN